MNLSIQLIVVVALVALATVGGLIWKARTGTSKKVSSGEVIDLKEIGAIKDGKPVTEFGDRVTFLQFSSEVCSQCAQTARLFHELEAQHDDVLHIEVDITNRLDLANKFNILQTPTTLVLDKNGVVTSRIGGAAKSQTIQDELGSFHI
ncbi:MAG: thioredoxin family protein [Rhodoluna sp.]